MAHITHDVRLHAGSLRGGWFARFVQFFQDWRMASKVRKELTRLTDRELDDLGISRAIIDDIARGKKRI
ncbi:MAG: DUF1127 domain-containing protein [Pseudomonadota bacterium]